MIIRGDCIEQMKQMEENLVDAIITDPPYGLEFMGKNWDKGVPGIPFFTEMIRVLKPGGYLLSFGGTRTYHRMAVAIEDAGFEIRDCISWIYASGFPKSLNVHKQIEKVYKCGNTSIGHGEQNTKYNLRSMSEEDLPQTINSEDKQRQVLQSELQEQSLYKTMQRQEFEEGNERGEKPRMEGRGNLLQEERKLQRCEICKMPKEIYCYVPKGWVYNGTQIDNGKKTKKEFNKDRSSTSHRSQSREQQSREPYAICEQCRTQTLRRYEGIGTALKPAQELICIARKPLSEKNVALNVLKWGTGGINIDESRVGDEERTYKAGLTNNERLNDDGWNKIGDPNVERSVQGRFPANIILDEEAGKMLDEQSGELSSGVMEGNKGGFGNSDLVFGNNSKTPKAISFGDKGGASRFFYCAKASKSERNLGCEELEENQEVIHRFGRYRCKKCSKLKLDHNPCKCEKPEFERIEINKGNNHPTVKPIKLMEYLIKLVSREGATILDPFLGSGTTAIACVKLNINFIGIEKEEEYIEIAKARLKPFLEQRKLNYPISQKEVPKGCGTEIGNSGTVNCGDTEELTGSQHLCKDCLLNIRRI